MDSSNDKRKSSNLRNYFQVHESSRGSSSSSGEVPTKKTKTSSSRILQVATAEKWKSSSLAKFSAPEWLVVNTDESKKYVVSMQCSTCTKYKNEIMSLKGFAPQWCSVKGSTRLQHSAPLEHATTSAHERSFELFLKRKGVALAERSNYNEDLLEENRQGSIVTGIATMNKKDIELTRTKMETAYFVAKEELPLTKYETILDHEERHGVNIGTAYRNRNTGCSFMDTISESLANDLKVKLDEANFYSVLTDGSTDSSTSENEAVFIAFFDPKPDNIDEVNVVTSFAKLQHLKSANAANIVESIKDALESIGIEDIFQKLVGFGSDGAAVNCGRNSSVKTMLQETNPWLMFGWCSAHRLELALKDSLRNLDLFKEVDEIILRLYYLYKKSPKKLNQLKDLFDMYEEDGEFFSNGYRPKRASGTRWISHKVAALETIIDKYGIYMTHLQELSVDTSYSRNEINKFRDYFDKWSYGRVPLLISLFLEILSPAKILSKGFQEQDIDVVKTVDYLKRANRQFARIKDKEYYELPSVKRFMSKVETSDHGVTTFNGIEMKDFENALGVLEVSKNEIVELIEDAITVRLIDSDSEINKISALVLNTEAWPASQNDDEFLHKEIQKACEIFEIPLQRAGYSATSSEILEQWRSLTEYATTYLNITKFKYRKVWKLIFASSRAKEWKDILLLVELLFCFPISNAAVERFFSLLNRVKTDGQASLGNTRLNSLLRICMEGPECADFDATKALNLWSNSVLRRPNQSARETYKPRNVKGKFVTLVNLDDDSEDDV